MKLRTKFAIVLFVVMMVLSTATYGGLELYKQETLERNQESVDESARLASTQISEKIRESVGDGALAVPFRTAQRDSMPGETISELELTWSEDEEGTAPDSRNIE